jgi:GAF domain-containing protein
VLGRVSHVSLSGDASSTFDRRKGLGGAGAKHPGKFDDGDAEFLAGFAGLLGIAIGRQHADAKLQKAVDHEALLTGEWGTTSRTARPRSFAFCVSWRAVQSPRR